MKPLIVPLAAAVVLIAVPALAQSPYPQYRPYAYGGYSGPYGGGWVSRPVSGWTGAPAYGDIGNRPFSDPSNVSPGYLRAKALGRCVQDLGYGRYEYC